MSYPLKKNIFIDKKTLRRRVVTTVEGDSLTEQSHKNECDINQVMKRLRDGEIDDFFNKNEGSYQDITSVDYHDAQNKIAEANSMFEELPSHLRNKFSNNPAEFLDFVQNPDNLLEMVDLGLAETYEPARPIEVAMAPTKSDAKADEKDGQTPAELGD